MRSVGVYAGLTVLLAVMTGSAAAGEKQGVDVRSHLEGIKDSYYQVVEKYPWQYTCELRSPELVASMDKAARKAWGKT